MENSPMQTENAPNKKIKLRIYIALRFLLLFLVIVLGFVVKAVIPDSKTGAAYEQLSESEIAEIQSSAEKAILTICNFVEGIPLQVYNAGVCNLSTEWYCEEHKKDLTEEEYENIIVNQPHCTIESDEFIDRYRTSEEKIILVFRIKYNISFEAISHETDIDQAVIMSNENGWKLFNTMDYEEFVAVQNEEEEE